MNKSKINFYNSMATLYDAGVPVVTALRQDYGRQLRQATVAMADAIDRGEGRLSELMGRYPRLFSQVERQLVDVGERTGALTMLYRSLARWYELRQRTKDQVVQHLTYPAFMYHATAVLLPVLDVLIAQTPVKRAVLQGLTFLAVPYAAVLMFGWILPTLVHNRSWLDRLWYNLPLLGGLVRAMTISRFFHTFHLAVSAGLGVPEAVRMGAGACGNQVLQRRLMRLAAVVETEHIAFSEAYQRTLSSAEQSLMILTMLQTAELTGSIDQITHRIAENYQEIAEKRLRQAAVVGPTLIYLVLVGYLAYHILTFWSSLYAGINAMMP